MSKIHYFQRYSQKENVATNNTLQLFSRLYAHNPSYLETFLNDLAQAPEAIEVGPAFAQQATHEGGSVPDALIEQKSFKIVMEAKHHTEPTIKQLEQHLEAFGEEDVQFLVLLTRNEQKASFQEQLTRVVRKFNQSRGREVTHVCTTFHKMIQSFSETLAEHDYEMRDLLEDYADFCSEEDLLPGEESRMRAVPCSRTIEDNFSFDLYYREANESYQDHRFIGIYDKKTIRGIGKVSNIVVAKLEKEEIVITEQDEPISEEQRRNIRGAMSSAYEKQGWDLFRGRRFFLVDKFYKTDYRKESSHAMRGPRYFDLAGVLKLDEGEPLPPVEEIAELLKGEMWR